MFIERLAWQLAQRSFSGDPYGRAILGDLLEMREDLALTQGSEAAARWFYREALRSWLAFLPSLRFGVRTAASAALVTVAVYGTAVTVAAPMAFRIGAGLHATTDFGFALVYFVVVAAVAAIAGYGVARFGNAASVRVAMFLALTAAFGARHIIVSAPGEVGFRVTKVLVFATCALIAALLGPGSAITRRGIPLSASCIGDMFYLL